MRFDLAFMIEAFWGIMGKFPVNLHIALNAFLCGFIIAILIIVIRVYNIRILVKIIDIYISIARAVPIYLQIVLFFFGLPVILRSIAHSLGMDFNVRSLPPILTVSIALTFTITAYLSEALRGSVAAIRKGEIEAAYSLGMTTLQILRRVILPTATVLCLPSLCVLLIGLTHSTTLAFGATILEMNGQASLMADSNGLYFEAFLAAGILFWIMTAAIEFFFRFVSGKTMSQFDKGSFSYIHY
jgi:His/Glu/Gln/Arg/opine family amino acid ABC transporter permease subunit